MTETSQLRRLTERRPRSVARHEAHVLISPFGLVLAGLFFTASLTPSLIPRDPAIQGALGGAVGALGYWLGGAFGWLWRFMDLPRRRASALWPWLLVAGLVALAIAGWGLIRVEAWQNMSRATAGVPLVDETHMLTVGSIGAGVFVVLLVLGLLFGGLVRAAGALIRRVVSERVAFVLGLALAAWVFWALIDGVLVNRMLAAADEGFEAADALIDPEVPAPTEPGKTGGPGSLVQWDEMGRWGRSFVALAPTEDEIEAFAGQPSADPIRVYVGRRAADTPEARAQIALDELIRQGGFDKGALLVMVPVGTGWLDPGGQDTLEFMLGGDIATVAVQYSYLTSVLSLITNPEYGVEQSRALFQAVYSYWQTLPPGDRPRFYVHGLSQGALNSQLTLPLLDLIADPIDGALWAGSPFLSPFWAHVKSERDPASPPWRPRFGNGSLVRAASQEGVDPGAGAAWGPMRFVFLNYGSDPIVHFSWESAIRRPDWLVAERAPDVSPDMRWFPVVTMFQTALDMAISLQAPRHGHFYVAPDYIDAWAALLDPPGWSAARATELKDLFEARPAPW